VVAFILSLNEQDTSDIFKVLVAADKLFFQELVEYLQKYLNPVGYLQEIRLYFSLDDGKKSTIVTRFTT